MPLRRFLTHLDSNEYQTFGNLLVTSLGKCFASLVVYFAYLTPYVHFHVISCIALRHHLYTPLLLLPFLGLYLVSSPLTYHVYLILWASFSHSSCTPYASLSLFLYSFLSLILIDPFVYLCQKGAEYTRVYWTLVHIYKGRNSIREMQIQRGRRHLFSILGRLSLKGIFSIFVLQLIQ